MFGLVFTWLFVCFGVFLLVMLWFVVVFDGGVFFVSPLGVGCCGGETERRKEKKEQETVITCSISFLKILSKVLREPGNKMQSPDCSFSGISVTVLSLKFGVYNSYFFSFPPDILHFVVRSC